MTKHWTVDQKTFAFIPKNTPEYDGKIYYGYGTIGEANAYRRELEAHYKVSYKLKEIDQYDLPMIKRNFHIEYLSSTY